MLVNKAGTGPASDWTDTGSSLRWNLSRRAVRDAHDHDYDCQLIRK